MCVATTNVSKCESSEVSFTWHLKF